VYKRSNPTETRALIMASEYDDTVDLSSEKRDKKHMMIRTYSQS
jgi:hypothetical protein